MINTQKEHYTKKSRPAAIITVCRPHRPSTSAENSKLRKRSIYLERSMAFSIFTPGPDCRNPDTQSKYTDMINTFVKGVRFSLWDLLHLLSQIIQNPLVATKNKAPAIFDTSVIPDNTELSRSHKKYIQHRLFFTNTSVFKLATSLYPK